MKNIKIIKAILSITVFLLGAYSLLTKNFAYQNLSMFCAGLLVITIGIEESKKGKNRAMDSPVFCRSHHTRTGTDSLYYSIFYFLTFELPSDFLDENTVQAFEGIDRLRLISILISYY